MEAKLVSNVGSLALVAKGKNSTADDSESEFSGEELSKEDKVLMVSNPKKFFKKNLSHFRNKYKQGNSSSQKPREEGFNNSLNDEEKKEKKLLGDSGYNCNYYHGNNHFAKEYMLRKQNGKKENVKDEAYYAQKIEELRKKNSLAVKLVLIVEEESDEGRVEVWSIDSKDDEVRKPTHGGCFVVKSEKESYASKCLMVHSCNSEPIEYVTGGGKTSESCFAVKTITKQVKECEKVVKKVHSILKALNFPSSRL